MKKNETSVLMFDPRMKKKEKSRRIAVDCSTTYRDLVAYYRLQARLDSKRCGSGLEAPCFRNRQGIKRNRRRITRLDSSSR